MQHTGAAVCRAPRRGRPRWAQIGRRARIDAGLGSYWVQCPMAEVYAVWDAMRMRNEMSKYEAPRTFYTIVCGSAFHRFASLLLHHVPNMPAPTRSVLWSIKAALVHATMVGTPAVLCVNVPCLTGASYLGECWVFRGLAWRMVQCNVGGACSER